MTAETQEPIQTQIAKAEVERRTPKVGPFNEFTVGAISSLTFGIIGAILGSILGRMGDGGDIFKPDETIIDHGKKITIKGERITGRGELFGRWLGGLGMGLTGAAVMLRTTREARQQAEALAKQNVQLEYTNEALASTYTHPVGSLIQAEKIPETAVNDVKSAGLVEAVPEKVNAI